MRLNQRIVVIKSGGEIASAIASRLYQARIQRILILESKYPLAVRRTVSFCEAVHNGTSLVEDLSGVRVESPEQTEEVWAQGHIPVLVDPAWTSLARIQPDVLVDAIIAKRNLGTSLQDAPVVIALGPGFEAKKDAHFVIETNRGHDLGRVLTSGMAAPDTGIPGNIGGFTAERVLRAPAAGILTWNCTLGDLVEQGQVLGQVAEKEIKAQISGVLRGQIRPASQVRQGLKIGDIDPRGQRAYLHTISDKGRALGGAVLEAILRVYH